MLVQAWPGGAAYVWETPDQRQCFAEIHQVTVQVRGCADHPVDPPLASPTGVTMLDTFFTDGWVRLIGADHQEVTGAACGDTPLTVRRIGTVADGARTLYALWFPNYTKGDVTLTTLNHAGATARATLPLGDIGDRTCTPVSHSG
ncbi:hypothetical protein [Kitasatospora terrestris]|uniref:Uncharacterized protein n=1 Tax=Kitasatospora terrestris TaxID=258051 RepID=A0ABP9DB12_9ACTN